jgi:hypothetical protein
MLQKLFLILLFFLDVIGYSQDNPDRKIMDKFLQTIEGVKEAIPAKGDIYGFSIGIKVAYRTEKDTALQMYRELKYSTLIQQAKALASEERFDRFDMHTEPSILKQDGVFVYQAGITPMMNTDKPAAWEVIGNEFTEKFVIDGKFSSLVIHTYGIVMVQKPNDGSIVADVYFYNKNGQAQLWEGWGNKSPKISYERMGPGSETHNSKVGENDFRTANGTSINIAGIYTPGHYLPVIQFRGCTQDFRLEDDDHAKRLEAVLELERKKIDWNDVRNHNIAGKQAFAALKTSSVKAPDLLTYFSKGNIVNGRIFNEQNEPITAEMVVVLEPDYTPTNFIDKKVKSDLNGYFEFKDIESGVYKLYLYEHKEKQQTVEVCNCPQKGETHNFTYTKDIKMSTGYDVYAHYYCDGFADAEVVWKDVKIVIPNDYSKIKTIDASAFEEDENISVAAPYAVNIPGYGKEYYFSECADANETPKELKMASMQGGVCFIDKSEDALNSLSVEMTPEHPNQIRLVLQFDMYIGESRENSMQMTVGTDSEFEGGTEFFWSKIDDDIIKKLRAGDEAQKVLTNSGGCKLTITFKPNN